MYSQTPNAGMQFPRTARYTGQECDGSTTVAADLAAGAVLQFAPQANIAEAAGRPTLGYRTPYCVVSEDLAVSERAIINRISSTSDANLRDGGPVPVNVTGYCRALVKAAAVVTAGVTLLEPVDDQFYLQPCSKSGVLYSSTAASTAVNINTNATSASAFDLSYTLRANTLNAGDLIRIRGKGTFNTTNSTDTAKVSVKIGSDVVAVTPTVDTADGDIFYFDVVVQIRTIGTSGTYVAAGKTFAGTAAAAAGAADISSAAFVGSTAINTTTTNAITVTVEHPTSSSGQKTSTLDILAVEQVAASNMGNGPIAVAMESKTVGSSAELTKVCLMQSLI